MVQKLFRLHVSRLPGETSHGFDFRQRNLAANIKGHGAAKTFKDAPSEKLFADLLKRQSNRVCADLTEADAVQIPAHLARLELVSELIRFAFGHDLVFVTEKVRSERQLCNPLTLADWQEVLQHTRHAHRAPAFLNHRESELETINHKLDLIAGLLASHPACAGLLETDGEESEVRS